MQIFIPGADSEMDIQVSIYEGVSLWAALLNGKGKKQGWAEGKVGLQRHLNKDFGQLERRLSVAGMTFQGDLELEYGEWEWGA